MPDREIEYKALVLARVNSWGWLYQDYDYGYMKGVCMRRFGIQHAIRYHTKKRKRKFKIEIAAKKKLKYWLATRKPGWRFRVAHPNNFRKKQLSGGVRRVKNFRY